MSECDCCHCKEQEKKDEFHREPIPETVYIVLWANKTTRQTSYKNTLHKHKALDNVFTRLDDAKAMTRIWRNGYILEAKVAEDISKRKESLWTFS